MINSAYFPSILNTSATLYSHTFHNRVITGSLTLPAMTVITLVLWLLPDMSDWRLWAGMAMTGLTTYIIIELNNRNSLLRIRSRMMSSTFLLLMTVCPMLHTWNEGMIAVLCFMLGYFTLFASYQNTRPEGYIFHSFLFAGIGSFLFPPMVFVALSYYIGMLFQLRNFRWRTFMAGILGFFIPFWLFIVYAIWNNQLDRAFVELLTRFSFPPPDYNIISYSQWITAGTIVFFAIPAFVHFFHTAYNDKIRTRMLFYIIATQEVLLLAGLALLPQSMYTILNLFIANSALLMAHYYALAKGRYFHHWFNLTIIAFTALGVFNYLVVS